MSLYLFDIDGVICKTEKGDYLNATPLPERIQKVNNLYESGNTIIFWTARGSGTGEDWENVTRHQLKEWGVKHHYLLDYKPYADYYIDDKAINDKDFFHE